MASWRTPEEKQALFEEVALTHLPGLFYAALRLSGRPADAEDLVQETMLRAWGAFDRFRLGTNARAWLYRILHNTFLNHVRRAEYRRTRPFSADARHNGGDLSSGTALFSGQALPDPAEIVLGRTLDARLAAALMALPAAFRAAVVVVDVGGFAYEEAAAILGCPVGTVRSRLHRARTLLRRALLEGAADAAAEETHGVRVSGAG